MKTLPFYTGFLVGYISMHIFLKQEWIKRTLSRQKTSPFEGSKSKEELEELEIWKKERSALFNLKHSHHAEEDNHLADELYKNTRVLCWVLTNPNNLEKKARHVKYTWSRHCNIVVFMSSVDDPDFPTVGLGTEEGRKHLSQKTIKAFHYVYEHYADDADWFLKADDDTYVIVDNLRLLLANHTPEEPIYFGRKFKPYIKQGYMSGGAGYVLSKEALRRFVEAFKNKVCTYTSSSEDVAMGRCLEKVGVLAGDSRDSKHRERFHPFPAIQQLTYKFPNRFWYHRFSFYPISEGPNCCSDMSVSFHYVRTSQMYEMEYYTYHLRAFGYSYRYKPSAPTGFQIEKSSFQVGAEESEPASQKEEQEEYEEVLAMLFESQDEDLSFGNAAAPGSKN